mmetsp:Transcript_12058/g.22955  ORF Transcript_12058/g.22955 Transcript_12058/m.22955 type:complete len:311 (-) Transcript_12058:1561-2493(-)
MLVHVHRGLERVQHIRLFFRGEGAVLALIMVWIPRGRQGSGQLTAQPPTMAGHGIASLDPRTHHQRTLEAVLKALVYVVIVVRGSLVGSPGGIAIPRDAAGRASELHGGFLLVGLGAHGQSLGFPRSLPIYRVGSYAARDVRRLLLLVVLVGAVAYGPPNHPVHREARLLPAAPVLGWLQRASGIGIDAAVHRPQFLAQFLLARFLVVRRFRVCRGFRRPSSRLERIRPGNFPHGHVQIRYRRGLLLLILILPQDGGAGQRHTPSYHFLLIIGVITVVGVLLALVLDGDEHGVLDRRPPSLADATVFLRL